MLRHSCRCFGTPAGATTLLLCGQPRFDLCFGTPTGAMALLLCGQARPDRCFGTHVGATALLLRGQARPDRCFGTPAGAMAPQYCIVPSGTYFTTSYSFLMIGLGSQTYI